MILHFQYKPLYHKKLPGWKFSFYYKSKKIEGIYNQNGKIEWLLGRPDEQIEEDLKKQIHELMLFHVYDH